MAKVLAPFFGNGGFAGKAKDGKGGGKPAPKAKPRPGKQDNS